MLFRTFSETEDGYKPEKNTSYISEKLGEKTSQRVFYSLNVTKAKEKAVRFITVIYPFGHPSEFDKIAVDAHFTDQGTFNSKGVSVEVDINSKKYELSYSL